MLFQNLPLTFRRFAKQKLTTSLHLVGLTLGISVCLVIGLFIRFELSFDTYHSKADRIYRVNQIWIDDGNKEFHYSTPYPLADAIRTEITGIETVTKVHHPFKSIIEINPIKRFNQDRIMFTDPDFLNVFDVKVLEGNGFDALRKPYQALLTTSTAKKFYGNEDAMGKVFKYNNKYDVTVAGIIKDFPENSHLAASILLSFSDDDKYVGTSKTHYGSVSGGSTFILLPEGSKPDQVLANNLNGIYERHLNSQKWMRKNSRCELEIQPLSDIHFNSKYAGGGEWVKAINTSWLWIFGGVGLAVLILACINFVNLSTAQALTRSKEVGVRKTIGAGKMQLIGQFILEAVLLVTFSTLLAIIAVKISLPYFNNLTDKRFSFDLLQSPLLIASLLAGILITSLLSGIYPSWLITRFRPVDTLKSGSVNTGMQSTFLRKSLVVTQFTISVGLLIGVLFIGQQVNYIRSRDIGFNKNNIVTVSFPDNPSEKKQQLNTALLSIPEIEGISFSTSSPGTADHWGTRMGEKGRDDPNLKSVTVILADERFSNLYGLRLLAGRQLEPADTNFVSETIPQDKKLAKILANEALVKTMGYESVQAAIGKKFWTGMGGYTAEIVGVVADFSVASSREAVNATMITQDIQATGNAGIKLKTNTDVPKILSAIESAYKGIYPNEIFKYNFLDEKIDDLYKSEVRLYGLFKIFSGLAILISCLGLWGLISLTATQRTKEVGIRKVMGASVGDVVGLLTKDFILLVSIAILIAVPLAYFGVHKWLQEFAYRVNMSPWVFIFAGVTAIALAMITVAYQAIKAAIANPVKSLRTE
ncbi:MAG: FtsX-like permease family protein [Saprospiraceae bacterium]